MNERDRFGERGREGVIERGEKEGGGGSEEGKRESG